MGEQTRQRGAHTARCPERVCVCVYMFGVVCVWDNEPTLPFCLCSEPAAVPQQIIFPALLTARPNSERVCVCVCVCACRKLYTKKQFQFVA